jgi:hypothetical protein
MSLWAVAIGDAVFFFAQDLTNDLHPLAVQTSHALLLYLPRLAKQFEPLTVPLQCINSSTVRWTITANHPWVLFLGEIGRQAETKEMRKKRCCFRQRTSHGDPIAHI